MICPFPIRNRAFDHLNNEVMNNHGPGVSGPMVINPEGLIIIS